MTEIQDATTSAGTATLARGGVAWTVEKHELGVFSVATLAAWSHTIDELRIGEFIAVPFGIANAAVVAAWPRLGRRWRALTATAFGLFWGLTVIPYHVVPLLEGSVTGQNVSGLSRVVAGVMMVVLAIAISRRRGSTRDASHL